MSEAARVVVDALLAEATPHRRIPVRVRRGDQTLDAEFTGYYTPNHLSVGYPDAVHGGYTHGVMGKEDKLETPVPSFDEWETEKREHARQEQERLSQQPPPAAGPVS